MESLAKETYVRGGRQTGAGLVRVSSGGNALEAGSTRSSRRWLHAAALAAFLLLVVAGSGPAAAAGVDVAVVTPNITFSNSNPVDGQTVTILVIVHNFGDTQATAVVVAATETGTNTYIGGATIASIEAQGQGQTGISWNVSGVGTKSVTVSVSAAEVDSNPDNNDAVSSTITVRARPDLAVNSVTFDNPTPPALSTVVEIRVQVANVGGSNATTVVLALYDGNPADGAPEIHRTTLASVPVTGPVLATYTWAIADKGGRHDIYAEVLTSTPAEAPGTGSNNVASGTVLVLTQFDIEVTTTREIAYDPQLNGFLIVRPGGDLTLSDSTFTILQERDNQFEFIVEDGGRLALDGATVQSDFACGVTLRAGAVLELSRGSVLACSVTSTGGALTATESNIDGGLGGSFAPMELTLTVVRGEVSLQHTTATWEEVNLESFDPVNLADTDVEATNLSIPNANPYSIRAAAGTVAQLRGLVAGPIDASAGSSLAIWRYVTVRASDFTGIPIGGAHVDVTFALSQVAADSVTTDTDGSASLWLLTDLLGGAAPQYVGSYLFDATYATYTAQSAANLPFYPTLTEPSTAADVPIVFPVIDPSDLFPAIDGDRTVETGTEWNVGNFMQDGNLRIAGVVNVGGGVFKLDQDRDFEKAIVLNGGTFNLADGSSLTSDYLFNIYLFDASTFTASGSAIRANAIVVFDSASVSVTDGSTLDANLILPGGSSLTLGSGVTARGAVLWARGGPSIVMQGAHASFSTVDVLTTADISLNGTTLEFAGHAVLRGQSSTSTLLANNSAFLGNSMEMEAGFINIVGSQFSVSAITSLWADTVQLESTTVAGGIEGLKPGSTAAFYDVEYGAITADPTAIVNMFRTLSFAVLDINGNPVTGGTFAIRAMPNGTTDTVTGELAAAVSRSLPAATIRNGVEVFEGNYRLTVSLDGGLEVVSFVVMDAVKTVAFQLPEEVVVPSLVDIVAAAQPTVLSHGDNITVAGSVSLAYAGRGDALLPRTAITLTIKAGTTSLGTVDTMPDGTFNWTGQFTVDEGITGPVQITVSGSYQGVTGQQVIFIEILVPDPSTIVLTLDTVRFEKHQNEPFVVSGAVKYGDDKPAPYVKIRVFFTIPPQAQEYFGTTDENGLWSVTVPGRRTASTYSISVEAWDEPLDIYSSLQGVTVTVISPTGEATPGLGALTLPILAIAGAAAAAVIGFLLVNAKRRSVNYVECGNCGRPVHEGQNKCPSCGVEFEEDIAKCSHCASWIPADAVRCPKCNTEFKPVGEALADEGGEAAPKEVDEPVRAEVTTTGAPAKVVKQPVPVKKKILKRAVAPGKESDDASDPFADSDREKADDLPADEPEGGKKDDSADKGLFDDL